MTAPTDEALVAEANRLAPEALARKFHDAYERLAPSFGYETRKETRAFDPTTPNGRLMIAVCGEIAGSVAAAEHIATRLSQPPSGGWDDAAVEREEIGRIIDPKPFDSLAEHLAACRSHGGEIADRAEDTFGAIMGRKACDELLAKADAIRALFKRAALNAAAPRESLSVEEIAAIINPLAHVGKAVWRKSCLEKAEAILALIGQKDAG